MITVILNIPFPLCKEGILDQSYPRFSASVILHCIPRSMLSCMLTLHSPFFNYCRQMFYYLRLSQKPYLLTLCHFGDIYYDDFILHPKYQWFSLSLFSLSFYPQITCLFILLFIHPVMDIYKYLNSNIIFNTHRIVVYISQLPFIIIFLLTPVFYSVLLR